jgi:uncharacterized protein (TIGR02594 family)
MKITIIDNALNEIGVSEIVGKGSNPVITGYYNYLRINPNDDDVAWCSLFANYICKKSGFSFSNQLNARSWLTIGAETKKPEKGDIVVFWRNSPNSWEGHVAFFICEDVDGIWVLGGNQSNKVSIEKYPKDRVLGYRDVSKKEEINKTPLNHLKKGDKGNAVKQLQKMLGITADGDFGPKTEKTVKEFQAGHKLPVTGETSIEFIRSIIRQ